MQSSGRLNLIATFTSDESSSQLPECRIINAHTGESLLHYRQRLLGQLLLDGALDVNEIRFSRGIVTADCFSVALGSVHARSMDQQGMK